MCSQLLVENDHSLFSASGSQILDRWGQNKQTLHPMSCSTFQSQLHTQTMSAAAHECWHLAPSTHPTPAKSEAILRYPSALTTRGLWEGSCEQKMIRAQSRKLAFLLPLSIGHVVFLQTGKNQASTFICYFYFPLLFAFLFFFLVMIMLCSWLWAQQ